jgi:hypothetical protein
MATMAAGTDLTASGVNVATKLTHFATKAEVVVEFAKVSAGSTDLSGVAIADFVTNVNDNLDEDHTAALANLRSYLICQLWQQVQTSLPVRC